MIEIHTFEISRLEMMKTKEPAKYLFECLKSFIQISFKQDNIIMLYKEDFEKLVEKANKNA